MREAVHGQAGVGEPLDVRTAGRDAGRAPHCRHVRPGQAVTAQQVVDEVGESGRIVQGQAVVFPTADPLELPVPFELDSGSVDPPQRSVVVVPDGDERKVPRWRAVAGQNSIDRSHPTSLSHAVVCQDA
ncbi:MAG TPA: hypothetical protein VGL06_16065 [Pseudonocardiaceae bacterium]